MDNKLFQQLTAEFVGTFILVLIGGFSVVVVPIMENGVLVPAFAHGLVVLGLVYMFGHISGGHYNPSVTTAFIVARKIELTRGLLYMAVQFAGGIVAAVLIVVLVPDDIRALIFGNAEAFNFGQTKGLLTDSYVWLAAILEVLLVFILVSVIFQAAVYAKAGNLAGVAIGMTLAACILAGGNLTGASLNPARTLGPALMAGDFAYILPYFIGLFAGGALGGIAHTTILKPQ
ncbi:MAG: aquaporin [Chloroflexi bacterium AL-W]|nr:aquaporin [Chloroflexi bacterium AL-W]